MPLRPATLSRRRLCLLTLAAATTACSQAASSPTATLVSAIPPSATPVAPATSPDNTGPLTIAVPLTLDSTVAVRGGRIVGRVVYVNATASPLAIRNIVIVARPASGASVGNDPGFTPGSGAAILVPGQQITLTATRTIGLAAPPGDWYAASRYQDNAGVWHDAPTGGDVAFTVQAPAAIPTVAAAGATPTLPPARMLNTPGPLYWGAYIDGVPWDMARQEAFEARTGKGASLMHWGQAWWHDGQYQPFYASDFDRVRARGSIPVLDWGAWDYCCGIDQPAFASAAIARGDHDEYIRQWAAAARAWGHPLFLRYNHEMNGWWQFPWAERLNGNRPGDYVRAWRHVHDLFVAMGATNVTWVWCPNVVNSQTTPLEGLYPGDAYVDWVAMDGYNWGNDYGNTWQSFAEIFETTYTALRQLAPAKPIMIAEIGCQERGGDKAAWIRDALGVQLPAHFPAIKAVAWFNWDADGPVQTGAIESSAAASAAFGEVVGGSAVYLPNRFGSVAQSPIPVASP